jgi:hypothetical protein
LHARGGRFTLSIYDASAPCALGLGRRSGGEHALTWDLRDESGNTAGAGIYFARLEVDGRVLTRKLAKPR